MSDLSGTRVLVVDDNVSWLRVVTEELAKASVHVVGTAADGVEAIDKARALRPDVIIMDLAMPRLNGLDAAREIRGFAAATAILMVSNEGGAPSVRAAFAAGARGYMLKSTAAIELRGALETIVRGGLFVGFGLTKEDAAPGKKE